MADPALLHDVPTQKPPTSYGSPSSPQAVVPQAESVYTIIVTDENSQ